MKRLLYPQKLAFKILGVFILLFMMNSIQAQENHKPTLYFFLSDQCIITQYYVSSMNDLHDRYGEEVDFIAVFPNFSSKPHKIDDFYEKYKLTFPHQTDYYKRLTRQMGVTITPEVVLYDSSKSEILYQGRIDNSYASIGKRRRVVTAHELSDALQSYVENKEILSPITEAIGCFINFNDQISSVK